MAEDERMLKALATMTENVDSNYALGGKISCGPLLDHADDASTTMQQSAAHPMTIRWDGAFSVNKINSPLPSLDATSSLHHSSLQAVVNACQPATFGRLGEDVLDESYRKAGKLDTECLSTNFHPADWGMTDAVAQALLPNVSGGQSDLRGVHAELYKLNVYSDPSGHFKAHVDTPRSDTQFGSLVVCLPCTHEGDNLVVRHGGHQTVFEWQKHSTEAYIQRAAFYSDCEHEVLPVTKGHRITLTYNLYASLGAGQLAGRKFAMDPGSLPLYSFAQDLLKQPGFMEKGGIIGFYCTHAYAHATRSAIKILPWCLKGLDMTVYETFKALNCHVILRPVFRPDMDSWYDRMDFDSDDAEELGVTKGPYTGEVDIFEQMDQLQKSKTYIGTDTSPMEFLDGSDDDNYGDPEMIRDLNCVTIKNIKWLNRPHHQEDAVAYLAYGNNSTLEHKYSSAALFIKVLPAAERLRGPVPMKTPKPPTAEEIAAREEATRYRKQRIPYQAEKIARATFLHPDQYPTSVLDD